MSKPNQLIDAVKAATAIHNGDYSSLRGKSFVIRDNIEKKKDHHHRGKTMKKPTLSQRLDELTGIVKDGFKRVDTRIDNLEVRIDRVESRIDQINARLDYYGLQIEGIQKRLDYNGLKKLPESR